MLWHLAFRDTTRIVNGTAVFFVVCYFEQQKQINVGSVKRVVQVNMCESDVRYTLQYASITVPRFLHLRSMME